MFGQNKKTSENRKILSSGKKQEENMKIWKNLAGMQMIWACSEK